MSRALILNGGTPNLTLMSGVLCAFEEKGVTFDVISTAGAGAIAGLVWMAPKNAGPSEALRNLTNLGVYDTIYRMFPVDYKVFEKPGLWAEFYRFFMRSIPWVGKIADGSIQNDTERLFADWVLLLFSMFSPTGLTPFSKGLCAHPPFVSRIVNFEGIRDIGPEFYINAYNITDRKMEMFSKNEIGQDHFYASMSFPFLYPPYMINEKYYFEGAAKDCLNYKSLLDKHPEIDTIVIFEMNEIDKWIRTPRNLYDAWILSMIIPLAAVARDDTKIFELKYNTDRQGKPIRKLLKVPFDLSDEQLECIMDWSYGNLRRLFEIGFESGTAFCDEYADELF
jgi:predicted acylesterase/phospholipase RssA